MSLKENLYTFSVLQYRHDPWIGEAMNVGVLLSAPEVGFLKMRVRTASPRLTHAYPELGANDFRMLVRSLEKKVASLGQSLQHRSFFDRNLSSDIVAKRLLPDDDSALQWRKPGAGITSSPDEELERIFSRYVTRWDPSSPRDNRSDEDVYATFQRKLKYAPAKLVFEEKTIKTPRFGEVRFKHTFQNGRLHVVQPISFDLSNAETLFGKAAKMHGNLIRLRENPDVLPYLVTGAPRDQRLASDYHGAIELLREAGVAKAIVDEKDSGSVAETLISAARNLH